MPLAEREKTILKMIYKNPGIRINQITKKLKIRHNQVINAIMRIETDPEGALLADNKKGLSIFKFNQE